MFTSPHEWDTELNVMMTKKHQSDLGSKTQPMNCQYCLLLESALLNEMSTELCSCHFVGHDVWKRAMFVNHRGQHGLWSLFEKVFYTQHPPYILPKEWMSCINCALSASKQNVHVLEMKTWNFYRYFWVNVCRLRLENFGIRGREIDAVCVTKPPFFETSRVLRGPWYLQKRFSLIT